MRETKFYRKLFHLYTLWQTLHFIIGNKACSLPKPHDTIVNIANTRFQQATALRAVQYVVE